MTSTETAGRINPDWLAAAAVNAGGDETIEAWFARAGNYDEVEIDDEGCVWVRRAGRGYWLTQEQTDDECDKIDAGV